MKAPGFIARPAVEVVEFTDPTIANAGIELIEQDAVLLASTQLRVRRVIVRLETAAVVFHSANQRVRSSTSAREELLAYVVFGPQVFQVLYALARVKKREVAELVGHIKRLEGGEYFEHGPHVFQFLLAAGILVEAAFQFPDVFQRCVIAAPAIVNADGRIEPGVGSQGAELGGLVEFFIVDIKLFAPSEGHTSDHAIEQGLH